jgi:hypothetical protein
MRYHLGDVRGRWTEVGSDAFGYKKVESRGSRIITFFFFFFSFLFFKVAPLYWVFTPLLLLLIKSPFHGLLFCTSHFQAFNVLNFSPSLNLHLMVVYITNVTIHVSLFMKFSLYYKNDFPIFT